MYNTRGVDRIMIGIFQTLHTKTGIGVYLLQDDHDNNNSSNSNHHITTKCKVGQSTQKQDGAQHTFFQKSCGVGSCALHEIDARSLLRHRAH